MPRLSLLLQLCAAASSPTYLWHHSGKKVYTSRGKSLHISSAPYAVRSKNRDRVIKPSKAQ